MVEPNPSVALLPDHNSLAKDPKATEDYSKDVMELFERLPAILEKGATGLDEATETILLLEKRARQSSDGASCSKLCCKLLELHKQNNQWNTVNEFVIALCKKRGQLKRSISDMITLGMSWLDETPDKETKVKLIKTLTSIAEGKIFVEVERARLIRKEAEMLEEEGKIDEAALLLQEVQVETYGAMDRREKSLYVLDQMRLVLARKDFIRLQIISKKINPKFLEADDFQDIKLEYYRYMVEYYLQEKDYLNTAKSYWASFNTPTVQIGNDWRTLLSNYVVFLIMAPHSDESLTLLKELKCKELKMLNQLPDIKAILSAFLSTELSDWPLSYEDSIRAQIDFFKTKDTWKILRSRFIQHNILILSQYYSRLTTSRAASLLNVTVDEIEQRIAELVNDRIIYARIDRPAGIIALGKPATYTSELDSWAQDVSTLLDLLRETTHLISNDRMVHAALEKRRVLLEKSKS